MPVSSSINAWNLTMAQGSAQGWAFQFLTAGIPGGSTPYTIDSSAWQYVVRDTSDDGTGTALVSITPTSSDAGQLTVTVTASLSQVLLDMYSAATSGLAPGTYSHSLWEYPGEAGQVAWLTGSLIVEEAAQP